MGCVLSLACEDLNPLTPNDPYSGRTAPLTCKRCILYIYSTNIGTEYFKHGIYSPFFSSSNCSLFHNSNVFGSCIIHILYTGVLKLKKNNSGARRLMTCTPYQILFWWSNQEDLSGLGMWHIWGRGDVNKGFGGGDLKERDHLEDLGVDGNIILKRIFKK